MITTLLSGNVYQWFVFCTEYINKYSLSLSLRNYFLVNTKDSPPEFWNANTFTFMRILDSKPPVFPVMVRLSLDHMPLLLSIYQEWANVSAFPTFVAKIRHLSSPTSDVMGNKIVSHLQPQENRVSQV